LYGSDGCQGLGSLPATKGGKHNDSDEVPLHQEKQIVAQEPNKKDARQQGSQNNFLK